MPALFSPDPFALFPSRNVGCNRDYAGVAGGRAFEQGGRDLQTEQGPERPLTAVPFAEGSLQGRVLAGQGDRLAFADLLRGLAAVGVTIGHLGNVFLRFPDVVASIILSETYPKTHLWPSVEVLYDTFDLASIGVAVFFLISGFVIPLSLERTDFRAYFLKRFLRIFPTYWIALAIGMSTITLSAWIWSKPIYYDAAAYVSNIFLAANAVPRPDILSVGWTLQIEIKFYLLAPFIYLALKRGRIWPVLLCAVAITGFFWNATAVCDNVLNACWDHYRHGTRMLWFDAMFIIYMLIGSMFYALYRSLIPKWQGIAGIVFLFACYNAAVSATPMPILTADRRLPYIFGLLVFAGTFALRQRIRLTQPFRFLADISYSLYLLHPIVGYVTMRLLMAAGLPYLASLAAAVALVLVLAKAVHFYAERPVMALGKRLSATWFGPARKGKLPVASRSSTPVPVAARGVVGGG